MSKFLTVIFVFLCFVSSLCASERGLFLSLEKIGQKRDFITEASVMQDEIESKNKPGMLDLVSSVPGVLVSKAGSQIKSDANIRGIGDSFRRIGLFVDGRPEKMSVYGCGVSQTLLSGNVESVKIIKSPDSVLYGGDGFGGLINVKTAVPEKPFEGAASVSYGSHNTQNYFANLGGRTNKIIYSAAVNKISSDGHIKNAGYDANDYYARFGYRIDHKSELIISGKYFTGEEMEPKSKKISGGMEAERWFVYDRGGADIRYNRDFDKADMEIMAYGDFGEHKFYDGWRSKDAMYGINAHFSCEFFENNNLKYGAQYRLSDGKVIAGGPRKGEWKKYEFAFFALDELEISRKTKAFAGMRFNYDEISGSAFVPRAGLSYDITGFLTARAVYSRGFRPPYINELYTLPSSNKNLEAEYQNNYEIGLNSKYLDADFDITGFVINGDNIIRPPAKMPGKFSNSGGYVFKGIELSAAKEIGKKLKFFAGYSYLDPDNKTRGIAKNKIDLSADCKIGKFSLHAGGMFLIDYYADDKEKVKLEDFNVFNAKIHYNINDNFTIFAAADNFTAQKYEMYMVSFGRAGIYEMPAATYTAGAKYKF